MGTSNAAEDKKAELLAAIEQGKNALKRYEQFEAEMKAEKAAGTKSITIKEPITIEQALRNLENIVKIVDDFIEQNHEEADILAAFNFLKDGPPPTLEEANTFLEKLTPSKVKALLPAHEVTPQEEAALTYTKEERAARRNGSPEEAEAATQARINRAKAFLATLKVGEIITILTKGINGGRYTTFTPLPAAENEDYSTISTTQFYRVASEVINLADFDEAARRINRRKKTKAAKSGTMRQGALKALQVSERGGGLTLAISKGAPIEKIKENGQKEFDYVTWQIYKRDYDTERGQIKAGVISITDNDLVKYKVCGTDNKTVSRRNFLNFLTCLAEFKGAAVSSTCEKKKKGEPEVTIDKIDIVPLFKRITVKRGGVYELVPNEQFNWKAILQYYTYLPLSAFMLSGRAYQTLIAILMKARLTATDRPNPAEVSISLKEVADLLRLPLNTNEAKKLIKTPIRNIVDEINKIVTDVSLELEADESANKTEFLTGSIKTTFSGDLLQTFEKLKEQKEKNYKRQLAKHNRAINAQKQREANAAARAKAAKK